MMFGNPLLELLAYITHIIASFLVMFLCNYFEQKITDHYNHIFLSVKEILISSIIIFKYLFLRNIFLAKNKINIDKKKVNIDYENFYEDITKMLLISSCEC